MQVIPYAGDTLKIHEDEDAGDTLLPYTPDNPLLLRCQGSLKAPHPLYGLHNVKVTGSM
jgi:hypothetical protein